VALRSGDYEMTMLFIADHVQNKMPSETTDFASGAANWLKHARRRFWLIHSFRCKHGIIHKTGSMTHTALLLDEDRAMATGNMYRKYGEIWMCGFRDMQAEKQTDTHRHADCNTLHTCQGKK